VSQQTTNRSFDDLARALAEGSISRRRALKLFAGTAIAALIPSRALADDDDECVRVCHVPFNRATEECDFANAETRCVSRSRRRFHLENHPCDCRGRCANCLTMCLPNGGSCTTSGQCCSGNCSNGFCCASGRVGLSNGTCAIPCTTAPECTGGCECTGRSVNPAQGFCSTLIEGGGCATDAECPTGQFCARARVNVCMQAC
jgi:hypothetical protein